MRWRCRGRNEVTGVANVQVPLSEIKAFPFNSTNKKLLPLQSENLSKPPSPSLFPLFLFTIFFLLFFLFLSLPTHRTFSGPELFPHSLSLFFLSSHPLLLWLSPFWQSFLLESREKSSYSSPLLAFISDPFIPPASFHFPMHSALENSPSTSKPTLPNNSPHQFSMQVDSFKFPACFTTKDPYGFMVGCKEPKTRPKMDPQYSPRPIWSLWAQSM